VRDTAGSARGRAPTDDEDALRAALDADAGTRRRDAALGLVDLAAADGLGAETRRALRAAVEDDPEPDVRQFAVEALGYGAGDGGVATIRDALADDEEWVRAEAVVALSRTAPDPEAFRAALADDSGWVRRNAVIALGKTETATAEDLVDRIRNDPHAGVREYACGFLPSVDDDVDRAERILAALLARDPAAYVRAKAATGLGTLGTDRAERALEEHGLRDRSDDVTRAARDALAEARGVDPEDLDVDVPDGVGDPGPPGGGPDAPPGQRTGGTGRGGGRPRGGGPGTPHPPDDGA